MSLKYMTSTVGEEVDYTLLLFLLLLLIILDYKRVFALEIFRKQFQMWKEEVRMSEHLGLANAKRTKSFPPGKCWPDLWI